MSARQKVAALNAKIAEAEAKLQELVTKRDALQAEADAEVDVASITVGYTIRAKYGRGDKVREVVGLVKGRNDTEKLTLFKIETGSGYDTEILTVTSGQVIAIVADNGLTELPTE